MKFSVWTCPQCTEMTIYCKILLCAIICEEKWNFQFVQVTWTKMTISWKFLEICGKSWIFSLDMFAMRRNDYFLQNLGSGTNLWKKWNFQSRNACPLCTKMTFSKKISVLAQNNYVEKVEFSVWTCLRWTEMNFSCIIDQNSEISVQTWVIMEMLKQRWVVLM